MISSGRFLDLTTGQEMAVGVAEVPGDPTVNHADEVNHVDEFVSTAIATMTCCSWSRS